MPVVCGYDESPGAVRALSVAVEVTAAFDDTLVLVYGAAAPGSLGEEYAAHRDALHRRGHLGREPAARRPAGLHPAQAAPPVPRPGALRTDELPSTWIVAGRS